MTDDSRPIVRCIIAKPIYGGRGDIERSQIVSLAMALTAMHAGWAVVGPDPDDMDRLAAWEREHTQPFNSPRQVSE